MRARILGALAETVGRFRYLVLGIWLVVAVVAGAAATRAPDVLEGGSGDLPGSPSAAVAAAMALEFDTPFRQFLILTVTGEQAIAPERLDAVATALRRSPEVRRVLGPRDRGGGHLRSTDGRQAAMLVGLTATTAKEAENAVGRVRAALDPVRGPGVALALTGKAPMMVDMNALSEQDTAAAELRVLPLTLAILLVAFGSLVAATLPLIMGVVATAVTMGIVWAVGQAMGLSTLVQSVVTMIGLGVGIDYSLVLVKRYREALAAGDDGPTALRATLVSGGSAIAWSGLTVLVGMGSLLFTPLLETRSIGVGGILVVLVALTAGLTLLPAILSLLGPRVDAGSWIVRPRARAAAGRAWEAWASRVMNRPVAALLMGSALLVLMAVPALGMKTGFPTGHWLPEAMESVRGFAALGALGQGQLHAPLDVMVRSTRGPILDREHLAALHDLGTRLKADPRVRDVRSPLHLVAGMTLGQAYLLYADVDRAIAKYPAISEIFLSRDRQAALFTVVFADSATLADMQQVARELGNRSPGPGLALEVGGWGAYYNDFDAAMAWTYPRVFAFVLGATFLILLVAFRSLLVPAKAIVMNLLSVAAGYGVVVLVFQHGVGAALVGLDRPLGAIPAVVPVLLFSLLFGLSMDYEVFLLSRIREAYDGGLDNREAVARGLATTGGMITSAALIMAVVFGAFAWAQIAIVKMLGVGLAAAVLVDATVVRAVLVPAFMQIAGDWNWYPGRRPARPEAAPKT